MAIDWINVAVAVGGLMAAGAASYSAAIAKKAMLNSDRLQQKLVDTHTAASTADSANQRELIDTQKRAMDQNGDLQRELIETQRNAMLQNAQLQAALIEAQKTALNQHDQFQRELIDSQKKALEAQEASIAIANKAADASAGALQVAQRSADERIAMFKRSGVFDLHSAWDGINHIDKTDPNAWDSRRGANALRLTASLWSNDIIEDGILYDSYGDFYFAMYEDLFEITDPIPQLGVSGRSMLTDSVKKVRDEMNSYRNQQLQSRTIRS